MYYVCLYFVLQKVFPWQFLLEIILHQPLILQKIEMVTVVTLFKFSFANTKRFISNLSLIVDLLNQSTPSDKELRWQLFDVWFSLMSTLTDKIIKVRVCVRVCAYVCTYVRTYICVQTCVYKLVLYSMNFLVTIFAASCGFFTYQVNRLCEDKSTTDHVFMSLCDLLLYPVELLYVNITVANNVPIEVRAKLVPSWTKLMEAFSIAMVTTPKSCPTMNELVTMVVNKLVGFLQEQEAEVSIGHSARDKD